MIEYRRVETEKVEAGVRLSLGEFGIGSLRIGG
jgi:hypothetical protein